MSVVTVSLPPSRSRGLDSLLLDDLAPDPDVAVAAHRIVHASPATTFAAAKHLDLMGVRTPLLTASFWVRALPARVLGRAEPAPPGPLTLEGDLGIPGWMHLGERPGHEVAFGAIGVFWEPLIRWNLDVTVPEFAAFDEPGWGKIACSYTTVTYGRERTLLTYECRTTITDAASRADFRRYWWLIRPFVAHIMNATVQTIATDAEVATTREPTRTDR